MTNYRVDVDKAQLADAISLFEFVGGNTDKALRIAINKTGPKIKTQASRLMRQQIRFSAAYVSERLIFKGAKGGALRGVLSTPKFNNMLSRFDTNPTVASVGVSWMRPPLVPKTGIKIKVKPKGKTYTMNKSSFYMVINKGKNIAIAQRTSASRKPIQVFYGVSVSQAFGNIREAVLPDAGKELQVQMIDAMRYLTAMKYPPEALA